MSQQPIFPNSLRDTVTAIRQQNKAFDPTIGIILGSGMGSLVDHVQGSVAIDYHNIPGFPIPKVQGHQGRLVMGKLAGQNVACLQGRVHFYEGDVSLFLRQMVRTLKLLGCHTLLVTNAAGSLRTDMPAGSVMMITDHLNYSIPNPLVGLNDDEIGPRFIGMDQAYDNILQQKMRVAAASIKMKLYEGIYLGCRGPNFETPAEIRAFIRLGADAVGMSTIPEVILARHCGLRVAGLSLITNLGAGMSHELLTHEHTLQQAAKSSAALQQLVLGFLKTIAIN